MDDAIDGRASDGRAMDGRADVRDRIVEVAARLLREDGPTAVTTRGVADRAGVQAPTIYRLFGDKSGLLDAVAEHTLATYVVTKAAAAQRESRAEQNPLADLRAGWAMQVDFGLANPAVFRLLGDPHRALHSPAVLSGIRILESRVHRLATSGRLRVGEKRAVSLIHAAGIGVIQMLLETPPAERDLTLADTMFDAVAGQILTAPADKSAAGGATVAAVTLRAGASGLDMLTAAERRLLAEWLDRIVGER